MAAAPGMHALPAWLMPAALCLLFAAFALLRRPHRERHETVKRGALLLDGARWQRRARRRAHPRRLTVAGIAVPTADESKHFKILGATGSGKSTAIRELLGGALARGDRAVIADPDGGYQRSFHDRRRGDLLLNPFEADSVCWDLQAEIEAPYDVEQLASALIAAGEDAAAREWRSYARTFLAAVIRGCRRAGRHDMRELWRLLAVARVEELRPLLAGTPAQPFLEADNARMFGSIRAVAVSAAAALEHVGRQRTAPFGLRQWVRSADHRGVLFIPYRAAQIAALRSMIAAWLRLAIFEAMSQPEGDERPLWFVVDELDALGAIDGLKDALARLRKFGGRCVLGFQSIAQVSGTYGAAEAQTIVENCGNTLILRCAGSEHGGTSQFASRLIGDREVVRRQVARGSDGEAWFSGRAARRSRSVSEQHVIEPAVLPAQLEQLPDLAGYFKGASAGAWLAVSFAPRRVRPPGACSGRRRWMP